MHDTTESDLKLLLKARLVIGRLGERDRLNWWATDGILGEDGDFVGPRVLPRTHRTARARILTAVARHACDQRHPDPGVYHLYRLDPHIEDRLDAFLVDSLDHFEYWESLYAGIAVISAEREIAEQLVEQAVCQETETQDASNYSVGPDARSVHVPRGDSTEESIRNLVSGFIHSRPNQLTVPYLSETP